MKKFDIILIDFIFREDVNKPKDQQRKKYRPAMIISPNTIVQLTQITSHPKREDQDYEIIDWKESGLDKPSTIRFGQRMNIKAEDLLKYKLIGSLSNKDIEEIKKLKLDEAWRREPKEGDTYLVSKNRAPVAELIQAYLTEGEYEWGYVKHANGVINPTPLKGAEYKPWQVGVDYDKDDNTYIKVTAASEEDLEDAIKIANKFGKEYSIKDLGTRGKPNSRFHLLISLNEEDWDEPYVNPEDEVYQGKEESSNVELEEAFSIKVGVYNYRPSGIEARETYKIIKEEGKLSQLQDLLSRMWGDEEVDGDQIDDLLTNEKSWLFKMLDIEEEEN